MQTVDLEKIVKSDQEHLIHPLYHPNDAKNPFVWVKGEGSILQAADGREYIDGLARLWNVTLGHGRKELAQAAAKQMEQLAFTSSYTGHTNIPAVQLAERLSERCYKSISHFFFSSICRSGATNRLVIFSFRRAAVKPTTAPSRLRGSSGSARASRTS